jgi:radical SAM superfamily enzyme YgiQ (UPF0313 family)
MKVLLIQCPQVHRNVISLAGMEIPMNLAYLAAALDQPQTVIDAYGYDLLESTLNSVNTTKIDTEILDLQLYPNPGTILIQKLNDFQPDIVGITAFTIQANWVNIIAAKIKKYNPSIITIFGGVHASSLPESSLIDMPMVDVIVIGEGEVTLLEICYFLAQNQSNFFTSEIREQFLSIPGIAIRNFDDPSKVQLSLPRPLIKNLDLLPFPARHKLDQKKYHPLFVNYYHLPTTGLLSSRGCPFNCSYCSKAVFHRNCRFRSPENVVAEMEYCEKEYGISDFRFFDDSVTNNRRWIKQLCILLIQKHKKYTWNGFSRVDTVSKALLKLMKQAGCYHLKYGIETASQKILLKVHKKQSRQQVINAVKNTKALGIEAHGCFILNFPNESMDSIRNTINFAKELNPTYAMFSLLKPLAGSEIYYEAKKNDLLLHENWEFYGEEDPPILKNQLPYNEIKDLLRKAYNSFYLRPSYIWMQLKDLLNEPSMRRLQRLLQGFLAFLPSR